MKVSVLTPTITERAGLLQECAASVAAQTLEDLEHLWLLDETREGCAVMMNRLAHLSGGDWLLPLADDDLLLPGCLTTLLKHEGEGDIIYSPPLVWGIPDPWWFFQTPPAIPSFALIKRTLWEELGGYTESLRREEDRDLWTRALDHGAKFVRVNEGPTWVYRIHGGNKSFNNGLAS